MHWKVYGHDPAGLAEVPAAAGFTAGPGLSLPAAEFDRLEPAEYARPDAGALAVAAASGPHAGSLADFVAAVATGKNATPRCCWRAARWWPRGGRGWPGARTSSSAAA
uniref:Uncharacterized protein n=1 Tax=Streptomyces sp. NBC_00049 TaxID=2903617 RepID=A0AAU2JV48_9ACTN